MENILSYLDKYKDESFKEIEFNEIDNVIFSAISYSEFKDIIPDGRNYMSLNDALIKFKNKYTLKDAAKLGIAQSDSYKIVESIIDSKRYKDIIVYGYRYISSKDTQFCAMSFKCKNLFTYVAFEGTDHLLSGWKEDFEMVYNFPVAAHKEAIKYLDEMVSIFDKHVIIGGHSKGGNLALVSSMYCNSLVRFKIRNIYMNDGLGLREKQIKSKEYKKIEHKLIQIVPNYTLVSIMLKHNGEFDIVKSSRKDILAHAVLTWEVDGLKFKRTELSDNSKKMEQRINIWLDNHNDKDRKKMLLTFFEALEDAGIENLYDAKSLKSAINIIKSLSKIDKETRTLLFEFFKLVLMGKGEKEQ